MSQINLGEIFASIVRRYDEISPYLITKGIDMSMVRARQKPEDRKPIPDKMALSKLGAEDISGREGHCLSDPFIFVKAMYEHYSSEEIGRDFSHLADKFNRRGGLADSKAAYRQVDEYLSWHARLMLARMLNIELTVKPNLDNLEEYLGIPKLDNH